MRAVDLNSASEEELRCLDLLGGDVAGRVVAARPLRSWADVERIDGLWPGARVRLQEQGAHLGNAAGPESVARSSSAAEAAAELHRRDS